MRLFFILGVICLCVIVACFVVYATIGLPKTIQPVLQENSVTSRDAAVKKKRKSCSCCPTREERIRRGKILREKMEQAWAEQEREKQKSTQTPSR